MFLLATVGCFLLAFFRTTVMRRCMLVVDAWFWWLSHINALWSQVFNSPPAAHLYPPSIKYYLIILVKVVLRKPQLWETKEIQCVRLNMLTCVGFETSGSHLFVYPINGLKVIRNWRMLNAWVAVLSNRHILRTFLFHWPKILLQLNNRSWVKIKPDGGKNPRPDHSSLE